jgi:iron complex outermembrane recepter protein
MKVKSLGLRIKLHGLLIGTALSSAIIAPSAVAQTAATASGAEEISLDEIIVTGRKKAESLQDVPITVTSVGAAALSTYQVDQAEDIVSRIPSLNIQVGGSGSGGQISLRGLGSSGIASALDSAVAFDFDGVQVSTMRILQAGFVDVEQIDVLKGPQSLYFGKSASAGVLSIRSANPTKVLSGRIKASYEIEEKGYTVDAFISGPISDTLGFRLAGMYNKIDELLINYAPNVANPNRGEENIILRGTLQWEPTDVFNANLKINYQRNRGDGAHRNVEMFCGANGRADNIFLLGGALQIPAGYDCNLTDQRYFFPDEAPQLAAARPAPFDKFSNVPFNKTDIWMGRLLANLKINDHLTLTSTTGYLNLDNISLESYSYGGVFPANRGPLAPVPVFVPLNPTNAPRTAGTGAGLIANKLQQFSQEVRLASSNDGPFNFMVGGFYEYRKIVFDGPQLAANLSLAFVPHTGGIPGGRFTSDWLKLTTTKAESLSFFASGSYDITEELELAGGVRWTQDSKKSSFDIRFMNPALLALPPLPARQVPAFVPTPFATGPIPFSEDNLSPEVTLRYKVTPDVTVYAAFKTGFKSGGIDTNTLPSYNLKDLSDANNFSPIIFKSEKSRGGEIGVKAELLNRTLRINPTIYYYDFTDLQVQNFDPRVTQYQTVNADKVTTKGFDVDFAWQPLQALTLSGTVAYLNSKYTGDYFADGRNTATGAGVGLNLKGRVTPRAPKWSGNLAADVKLPITDSLNVGFNANARYSGGYFANDNRFDDPFQKSYWTLDTAVSISGNDDRWKLSVVAVNLTDKLYLLSAGGRPFAPPGGDDEAWDFNRGRQLYVEASFSF